MEWNRLLLHHQYQCMCCRAELLCDCGELSAPQNSAETIPAVVWIFYQTADTQVCTHSGESVSSLIQQQQRSAVHQVLECWAKRTRLWSEESLRLHGAAAPCSVKLSYCSLSRRASRSRADTLQWITTGNNNKYCVARSTSQYVC